MTSYFNQIVSVIIAFIVTLSLNYGLQYYFSDSGSVRIGKSLLINNQQYIPIEIENYSAKIIDNLKIAIPRNIELKNIISSQPINVNQSSNVISSSKNIIEISSIQGPGILRILLPVIKIDHQQINIVNPKNLKLTIKSDDDFFDPSSEALANGLLTAIIIFNNLFYFLYMAKS